LIITGSGWPGEDSLTHTCDNAVIMAAVNGLRQALVHVGVNSGQAAEKG